jgi:hypothetical protein
MNPRPADRAGAPETSGVVSVPGDQLDSLTRRVRLNSAEWRITLAILISPVAVSAVGSRTQECSNERFVLDSYRKA